MASTDDKERNYVTLAIDSWSCEKCKSFFHSFFYFAIYSTAGTNASPLTPYPTPERTLFLLFYDFYCLPSLLSYFSVVMY